MKEPMLILHGHVLDRLAELPDGSVRIKRRPNGTFLPGTHWRQPKPFWKKEWLIQEYVIEKRSTAEIASKFGLQDSAIIYWLKKHRIARRTVREARAVKHWGLFGVKNGMYGKTGALNPNYKDGSSPERQRLYAGSAWRNLEQRIFRRDRDTCRRCGSTRSGPRSLHAHHIFTWAGNPGLRFDPDNIITLCSACHRWVHGRKNIAKEFLAEGVSTRQPM